VESGREIQLEKAEFFRALGAEDLKRVRPLLRERCFARHQVLFFEGEPAAYLWTPRRGEVRLYKSAGGRVTALEALGPGQIFGALSALDEQVYRANAEALSAGVAWCLPRSLFLKLVSESPQLAVEILQIVSRRLREAQEQLLSFAHDPAPVRLARALLRSARDGDARVTRRELAEAAGTTVETAIRVLRRLEREGIVRGEVNLVHLVDEPALRHLAGEH
jgi:CRP/FNR family transcriptional regulator